MSKIVIVDYGVGNFRNVQKAFEFIGTEAKISDSPADIETAEAVVLPGVGAFGDAMDNLHKRQQAEPIQRAAQAGKPVFGICVGLQLLFDESNEMGIHQGLGLLSGQVTRFAEDLTVPHMGWNQIEVEQTHPLLDEVETGDYVYFANSYYAIPEHATHTIARTDYGQRFSSVVAHDNVCAIQFHPEKSQRVGLQILKNFVAFAGVN